MEIKSVSFRNKGAIPAKHTCDGEDISPELAIGNIPAGTKSLAVILDDPDSPSGNFVHWVAYDIAPASKLAEGVEPGKMGMTDFDKLGYGGPCPRTGTHRYVFKVYALDKMLDLPEGLTKNKLLDAMKGHVIENAELVGLYRRKQ